MNAPSSVKPLHLLVVEDSEDDTKLLVRELKHAGYEVLWRRVDSAEAMRAALADQAWDLILSDYRIPGFGGREALRMIRETGQDVPFILVSGTLGEDAAVEIMRAGAHDFVRKDHLPRLVPAVRRALQEAEEHRQLRVAEDQIRNLAKFPEENPNPVLRISPDGTILYANPMAQKVFAASDWFASRRTSGFLRTLCAAALEGRAPRSVDFDCEGQTYSVAIAPVADRGYVNLYAIDITERKRDQERLRLQSEALNAAVNGIVITDKDGQIVWVNPAFEQLTGYAAAEAIGQNPRLLKSGRHPQEFYQFMWETILAGRPWNGEVQNRRKDGSIYREQMTITPVRGQAGEISHFVAIKRDITREREAEAERVRLIQDKLLLLDSIDEGIYGVDLEKRCTFINRAGARMLGYQPEELVGRNMHDLIHHHRANGSAYPVTECPMYHALQDGKPCRLNNETFWRRDGSAFPVECSSHSVVENGQIKGAVITFTDITEKRQLEQQFLRAQRLEGIGTLASGIAHDLNNILSPILMGVQLLRLKPRDAEDDSLMTMMEASARRGADIVQQVLTFARGVEGAKVLVQFRHLIRDMAKVAKETFPKSIDIKVEAAADCWAVPGDPTQLHQVLLNLCVNARDAMSQGGVLTLQAENVTVDESYASGVPGAKPGPYVLLKVEDTGTGIPPAVLGRIFDPFFTTKPLGQGTGLGLSTVMGIVRSHGGFINVHSEPGRGAAFHVYLPATPGETDLPRRVGTGPLPRGQGETILVVDDEASIRDVAHEILQRHGYAVLLAGDGTEALALIAELKDQINVVLTDMLMPFMDGPTLVRALRKLQPNMKVIACSGLGQESKEKELAPLGVKAFLAKPFTTEKLLQTLHDVLAAPA